jgi:hypothetical protein
VKRLAGRQSVDPPPSPRPRPSILYDVTSSPSRFFPAFGLQTSLRQNLGVSAIFTAVSLVRGYVLRRLFLRIGSRPRDRLATVREP